MNTVTTRHSPILSAACAVALLCSTAALAAPPPKAVEVLTDRGAVPNANLPAHAKAGSGVGGLLNSGAMSAPEITLTLADGREISARLKRQARDDQKGTQSWVGTFEDKPGSVLVLSRAKGVVSGFANYGDLTLEILPANGGKHIVYAVDQQRLPDHEVLVQPDGSQQDMLADSSTGFGLGASTAAADSVTHDVLVVYTAASAARYGQASLEAMINSAVESANQAYLNSQVAITMNLVGLQQVALTEGTSLLATKSALELDTAVARLRDQVGADVVMIVAENSDACGVASLMTSNSTSFAGRAFGAVYSSCLSNQSLAHEIGHTQGLMHDRASSSYGGAYPYAYGYRVCASDGTGFRDVMSYACSGAPRVLLFSNPNVNYNGYQAGVSYESDPANSADNARALMNTASTVAAFRSSRTAASAPSSPSNLSVPSVSYTRVGLAWVDNASNESGYKVERSADGVNFVEIGSLGADASGFADSAVAALTRYYYRVRAFNSVGASGYSNTVSTLTPDRPPPAPGAPAAVTAANNTDGTASVAWSSAAGAVGNYEVKRETWNARKASWGSAVIAATVPSQLTSFVDASGAGTFRYSVRAVNAGGASGYAGPAEVQVSATTTGSSSKRGAGKKGP